MKRILCKCGFHLFEVNDVYCQNKDNGCQVCIECVPDRVCKEYIQVEEKKCIKCGKKKLVTSML